MIFLTDFLLLSVDQMLSSALVGLWFFVGRSDDINGFLVDPSGDYSNVVVVVVDVDVDVDVDVVDVDVDVAEVAVCNVCVRGCFCFCERWLLLIVGGVLLLLLCCSC